MILGLTAALFVAAMPFIWKKGPAGTGVAFSVAAIVAVVTAAFTVVTGLTGIGAMWRVEAIFCGLVLALSFVCLGIARAS